MNRILVGTVIALAMLINDAQAQWRAVPESSAEQPAWAADLENRFADNDTLDVLIEFRASDALGTGLPARDRATSATSERAAAEAVADTVRRHVDDTVRPAVGALRSQGLDITHVYSYQPIVRATIRRVDLAALNARDDIIAVHINAYDKADDAADVPPPAESYDKAQLFTTTVASGATQAWAKGYRGQGYAIAILDNGIVANHEMFKNNKIIAEACFSGSTTGDQSLCPNAAKSATGTGAASACTGGNSVCDHGTHVAGIAAGNNAATTSPKQGMAPDAKLIPIQVFSRVTSTSICDGAASCLLTSTADQISAFDWLIANGPAQNLIAVNISLGGSTPFASYCDTTTARSSGVNIMRTMGILTAIASGNDGFVVSVTTPACIKAAVTVGGTNITHTGANSSFNNSPLVDVLAPGTTVESAVVNATNPTTTYGFKSGTSMATPHVAGAIAVLKSRLPSSNAAQIEYALKAGGVSTTLSSWSYSTPRINVNTSLDFMTQNPTPSGVALIGYQPGAVSSGFSYIRLYNPNTYAGAVSITAMQDTPKRNLGTYRVNVPGRAALQIQMKDIEEALGQTGVASSTTSFYVDSAFSGFAQNIQWNTAGQSLTNLTTCKTTATDPNTFLGNVHTSLIQGYPSYIRIHNQGTSAAGATFDIYNANTGAFINALGTQQIESNTTITLPAQAAFDALGFNPGTTVFQVNFILRSGFNGVIAHIVDNTGAGVLTDMTAKCPI
ncbi:MAG: hypothetical protein EXR11_07110 [Rhodospirillaceae bacterium]|nr:hypothetical protein [Rhodospirillaceae bacterium]